MRPARRASCAVGTAALALLVAASPAQAQPDGALAGLRIALSAGHGIRFVWTDSSGDAVESWEWQRGVVGSLREDVHNAQITMDFLVPLLERAGATVITARERAYPTPELLLDNDDAASYAESGSWTTSDSPGWEAGTYRFAFGAADPPAEARWSVEVAEDGYYPVYVYFLASANRSREAAYRVEHFGGESVATLDQGALRVQSWSPGSSVSVVPPPADVAGTMNARWHYLGTWPFAAGEPGAVVLSTAGTPEDEVVIADALRVGADVSGLAPLGIASAHHRWEEAAHPNLEAVGVPAWVRDNDVTARSLYAIYEKVDAFFSFHTNCCNYSGTSTYVWYPEMWVHESQWPAGFAQSSLPPGTYDWAWNIHRSVVGAVRAAWDADWNDAGILGANFGELRPARYAWKNDVDAGLEAPTTIPSMLLEAAFHDRPQDTDDIREQRWRRVVARAIRDGMIRYFEADADALVPPLPPAAVAAFPADGGVRVAWRAADDPVEANAAPAVYRVYASPDPLLFARAPVLETTDTVVDLAAEPCEPLYVRVTAANDAGESLDTPTVGARGALDGPGAVLWVDGHDREVKTVHDPNNRRDYARILGPAMAAASGGGGLLAMATDDAVAAGLVTLSDYDAVIWSTGESSNRDGTLRPEDREAIRSYLSGGAPRLLVSGAEIGWDLVDYPDANSTAFMPDVLHADYLSDDAEDTRVVPAVGGPLDGIGAFDFGDCSEDAACMEWPDVLGPRDGGSALLEYAGGAGPAAVAWDANGSTVITFGFPLETVADPATRRSLLTRLVDMLTPEHEGVALVCEASVEPDPSPEPSPDLGPEPAPEPAPEQVAEAEPAAEPVEPDPPVTPDEDSGCGGCSGGGPTGVGPLALFLWAVVRRRRFGTPSC